MNKKKSNLPYDNFLKQKVRENEDGYVDISVLLTFNRLKSFLQLVLKEDSNFNVAEFYEKEFKGSEFLKVRKGRVRRLNPPKDLDRDSRSLIFKNLPFSWNSKTNEEIIENIKIGISLIFTDLPNCDLKPNLESVRIRKKDGEWRRESYIEFKKKEEMEIFMKLYKDNESKNDKNELIEIEEKLEFLRTLREKNGLSSLFGSRGRGFSSFRGSGRGRGGNDRGSRGRGRGGDRRGGFKNSKGKKKR
eukprot:gene3036-5046_t